MFSKAAETMMKKGFGFVPKGFCKDHFTKIRDGNCPKCEKEAFEKRRTNLYLIK